MKELLAGIQLVRTKGIQLNQHPVFKKKAERDAALLEEVLRRRAKGKRVKG